MSIADKLSAGLGSKVNVEKHMIDDIRRLETERDEAVWLLRLKSPPASHACVSFDLCWQCRVRAFLACLDAKEST